MSTFTVAGVSVNKGKTKVRFCSDMVLRFKNLVKQGDTDILLVDLPNPMTKVEACDYLLASGQFETYRSDIEATRGKKEEKATVKATVTTPPVAEVDDEILRIKELAEA
jgi:tRNA A58 N-methylase Trm61